MAKKKVEKRLMADTKTDAAVKALKEEKADRKTLEERIKKKVYELAKVDVTQKIVDYGMNFKRSTLCMIREKYLDLDLSDIDLTKMKGWDKPDPIDGFDRQKDQDAEGGC